MFLTTQRKDLRRFDRRRPTRPSSGSTRRRRRASTRRSPRSTANFQQTFTTLFGGGRAGLDAARRERPARERHRHRRPAARQAPAERAAAVGRREGAHGDGADVRDLQLPPEPVLPARRDRRAARRREHRPVRRDAAGHARPHAVHPHHAQPQDHGDRRPAATASRWRSRACRS